MKIEKSFVQDFSYTKDLKYCEMLVNLSKMSRVNRPRGSDNSPIENFFGLLKQEMYYGEALCSYEELKSKIERYINYYNNK